MNGYTVNDAAIILEISPQRVRQLVPSNAKRIGSVIILTLAQIQRMQKRNMKPGPTGAKKR